MLLVLLLVLLLLLSNRVCSLLQLLLQSVGSRVCCWVLASLFSS
jgi:hypothetical protein